jgi:hypothetical protein
MLNINEDDF